MVVDVHDRRVRRDAPHSAARAFEVAGVEEEDQLRIDSVRRLGLDVLEPRKEGVHRRQRRRLERTDFLAFGAQRFREREAAAEGVAVGVLVAEDQDLLVGVDQVLDLVVEVWFVELRGRYRCCSSSPFMGRWPFPRHSRGGGDEAAGGPGSEGVAGSTSFNSSEICTLYSIEGSSSNRSSGENLRFCRRRPSSCRMTPLAETRPLSDACCSSGLPRTETRTRACRRSGDMRTAVMLT